MSRNIYDFPDRKQVEEQAIAWLIKLDSDQSLSREELAELREWLHRSTAHREALSRLNQFWSNNVLTELMVPLGSVDAPERGGWMQTWKTPLAATLMLAFMLVLPVWWYALEQTTQSDGLYLTAVGQQKEIILSDGSQVQLNTNSQIRVEYSEASRSIWLLQGEAHFDVLKNPERPFQVFAGGGKVEAIGTAFTVHLEKENLNVLVTEGRVALVSLGNQGVADKAETEEKVQVNPVMTDAENQENHLVTLVAGDTISVAALDSATLDHTLLAQAVEHLSQKEVSRRESWREGILTFSGEPLSQVVEEISRFTTITIEITDPDLRNVEIGGRFRVGDIDQMLNVLETNFDLRVNRVSYNRIQLATVQ